MHGRESRTGGFVVCVGLDSSPALTSPAPALDQHLAGGRHRQEMTVCAATAAHELAALSSMRPLVPAAQGAGRSWLDPGRPSSSLVPAVPGWAGYVRGVWVVGRRRCGREGNASAITRSAHMATEHGAGPPRATVFGWCCTGC